MFLNVTVAITQIDRQSHVTFCHAARHKSAIAPTLGQRIAKPDAESIRSVGEKKQTCLAAIAYQVAQVTSVWPRRNFVAFIRHSV